MGKTFIRVCLKSPLTLRFKKSTTYTCTILNSSAKSHCCILWSRLYNCFAINSLDTEKCDGCFKCDILHIFWWSIYFLWICLQVTIIIWGMIKVFRQTGRVVPFHTSVLTQWICIWDVNFCGWPTYICVRNLSHQWSIKWPDPYFAQAIILASAVIFLIELIETNFNEIDKNVTLFFIRKRIWKRHLQYGCLCVSITWW